MFISLNKKKRVKLKFDTLLAKWDFETLESGEVQSVVYDLVVFHFKMLIRNLEFSNKPELREKFPADQKYMKWGYGLRIEQDEKLDDKFQAIHKGIDTIRDILAQIGFIITDKQISELNLEISRKFIELYGDRKKNHGEEPKKQ